ncbi:MAG TPA: hypothetical protein DF911_07045 [Erysipelotrichaceae bacterium]|nr:hypothetical protein [Erysipelotrichaceae bacterium]
MSMKKPLHTLRSPAIYLCILTTVFLVVMAAENAGFTRKNASLSQVFHLSTQDQLIDCSSDWTFKDGTPAQLDQLAVQTHGRNEPMAVIYTTIPIVSQLLWNVFGYDVHDCGPLIMSILIASFVHFIYVSVKDLPSEPKFLERYIWMIIGLATFMGTGFVDYFRHNIMGIRFQDTAAFSRTGYIFLMILLTIQYVNEIKWRLTTSMKAEIYRHQAYTDPLTGLGNRTSWRTSHDSLVAQMKEETLKKVFVVSIDLNHLKMINDEKGHIEGDEFVFVLIGKKAVKLMPAIAEKIEQLSKLRNVSLFWGTAVYTAGSKHTVEDVFHDADQKMYEMQPAGEMTGSRL